ncbi:pyridoxamine 5'-phosphate oxidase family protein [Microlunatus elymi]|uniref:Pyridoxamine 5'-phosphate oxidase family protein n=1 Tax=Microlunatus elymi TaxID=2596828 RepID=A0A516Q0F8_9ACTN|nr:pyridoxamine 5'-phosphate oxidase family protein [Microlunatus elymi]QDP96872.1 pyridoxamine 5'-phosphate oxidase family protein [Microlunatus elymi]
MDANLPDIEDVQRTGRQPTRFIELTEAQCEAVLASQTIGRVGWQPPDGPLILPVTYLYDDHLIIFRTSAYGVLAGLVTRTRVAFEVDVLDHEQRLGSSVLVQGVSGPAPTKNWVPRWRMDDVLPWASGTRHLFIAITIKKLTGRIIARANPHTTPVSQQERS